MAPDKITFTHRGKIHVLTKGQVVEAVRGVAPEAIRTHWAEIDGVRYPVKQVFARAAQLDRLDFATNQARDQLRRLGFAVGRVDDQTLDWDSLVQEALGGKDQN
jgi:hypothetical protein